MLSPDKLNTNEIIPIRRWKKKPKNKRSVKAYKSCYCPYVINLTTEKKIKH